MTRPTERRTARLILLDPADRILMIRYEAARILHADRPDDRAVWFTPGGGIEPGEAPEEAAARELAEETGITEAPIGPCVATRSALVDVFQRVAFTHERYFLVRARSDALDTSRLQETEGDPVIEVRWRTLADLSESGETMIPAELARLCRRLIAGDVPATPVVLA